MGSSSFILRTSQGLKSMCKTSLETTTPFAVTKRKAFPTEVLPYCLCFFADKPREAPESTRTSISSMPSFPRTRQRRIGFPFLMSMTRIREFSLSTRNASSLSRGQTNVIPLTRSARAHARGLSPGNTRCSTPRVTSPSASSVIVIGAAKMHDDADEGADDVFMVSVL